MIKSFLRIVFIIFNFSLVAQTNDKENIAQFKKYKDFDYINYNYKYLDSTYKIKMSSKLFDQLIVENEIIAERINSYKDSLTVALCAEFDNWTQRRMAKQRISMSWLRVSYYLWLSENETQILGEKYDFRMPYELYDFIFNQSEQWDDNMSEIIENLRSKVFEEYEYPEIKTLNTRELLNNALRLNPVRIKDFERIKSERRKKN